MTNLSTSPSLFENTQALELGKEFVIFDAGLHGPPMRRKGDAGIHAYVVVAKEENVQRGTSSLILGAAD